MSAVPEYTLGCVVAVAAVVVLDLWVVRTRLLTTLRFWLTMAICLAFQVPVDGWLTKLSAPIVLYAPSEMLGLRAPWDIPVEDFAFGFAMITLALMVWTTVTGQRSRADGSGEDDG